MLIVFDVDGTLIDANELDHRCFDEAFLEVTGVRLPGERWNQVRQFRETLDTLSAAALLRAVDKQAASANLSRRRALYFKHEGSRRRSSS